MTYIDGFLLAVPTANRQTFIDYATACAPVFREHGATRLVETWGDDVPRGELNDLPGAVQVQDDEAVLFSWVEWPDRAARDACHAAMATDPRMEQMQAMPFDGARMVYGGFRRLHDDVPDAPRPGYIDGVVLPIPADREDDYRTYCERFAPIARAAGATRVVDGWGDDVPHGTRTDFHRAALTTEGETVGFSWIEWPDKATRDAGWQQMMSDDRLTADRPFDGKRMIWGGFTPVVEA